MYRLLSCSYRVDNLYDNGAEDHVHAKLNEEVHTRQTDDGEEQNVCVACPLRENVAEEEQQTRDKDARVDDGSGECREYGAEDLVLFADRVVDKTRDEACRRALEQTERRRQRLPRT